MSANEGTTDSPVLVAGAGPTGMAAALALRARGVPVEIHEADPQDRERPGSRAIYVHGATLHALERNHPGLGARLAEEGLVWPTRRTRFRGTEVFSRTYDDPGGSGDLPHFSSLPQVRTEEFMLDALADAGVDVHWDSAVEAVDADPGGVTVETSDGRTVETPHLVGADGADSTVREAIGATFEGDRSANSFVIVDVAEHTDRPRADERVFHYDHPEVGGRNVLLVPFRGGWRVDVQCHESDDPESIASEPRINDIVATALGERYRDRIDWVSTYRFLQVTADRFVDDHRRVLLAGEAAHLFAPFGARGMNSGIADAELAASAVAVARDATVEATARREVERYAAFRERAAEWNKDAAGQALAHLQGDSPVTKVKKRLAAAAAPYWEPAGEWLDDAPYGPHGSPPTSVGRY